MNSGISRTPVRLFLCLSFLASAVNLARVGALQPLAPSAGTSQPAAPSFRAALPGYKYSFPRDHGAHPDFQTEWWYYTGHLRSTRGETFGYQLTFFRTALTPRVQNRQSQWATRDVIFAHLALTDETGGKFYFSDRISRAALGLAAAQSTRDTNAPRVWIDDWTMQFKGRDGNEQSFAAFGVAQDGSTPFGLQLTQSALKPPAIHGENGVSQKSEGRGRASHYYSFTRLQTTGKIRIGAREYAVTGQSWFDHEFGSNVLTREQVGWDWFSLQLDDGRELMIFQLRLKNGGADDASSGTVVEKDGRTRHLRRDEFQIEVLENWRSPTSQAKYPSRWKVTVPGENIALQIAPTLANQELDTKRSTNVTYWEGSVRATGTQTGKGYIELTGYDKAFDGTF